MLPGRSRRELYGSSFLFSSSPALKCLKQTYDLFRSQGEVFPRCNAVCMYIYKAGEKYLLDGEKYI